MTWGEGRSTETPPEDWGISVGKECEAHPNPEGSGRGQQGRVCEDMSFEVQGCGGGDDLEHFSWEKRSFGAISQFFLEQHKVKKKKEKKLEKQHICS